MALKPKDVRVPLPVQLILNCHWLVCIRGEGLTDRSIVTTQQRPCSTKHHSAINSTNIHSGSSFITHSTGLSETPTESQVNLTGVNLSYFPEASKTFLCFQRATGGNTFMSCSCTKTQTPTQRARTDTASLWRITATSSEERVTAPLRFHWD